MARRGTIAVLVLAALVVCSGCAAPFGDSGAEPETPDVEESPERTDADEGSGTTDESGSPDSESAEDDASDDDADDSAEPESPDDERSNVETTDEADEILPVDVYETHDRVLAMLDADAEMPRVEVRSLDGELEDAYEARQDPFQESLNVTETEIDTENARGIAWENRIVVDPNEASDTDIEQVLVHEYVHAVQFQEGWVPRPELDGPAATSTDYSIVETALIEGGAVWVTDRYADEFEAAFASTLDERADPDAERTTVERRDDRTVLVTVGPESFHETVSVSGSDGDYEVAVAAEPARESRAVDGPR